MTSKLTGNGLWESSRMMLPEHKEVINKYNHELQRKQRIELDEQELEMVNRALLQSMQCHMPITINMYDPYEQLRVIGIVAGVSKLKGQFKVGDDWFNIDDIEGIEQGDGQW